MEIIPVIDIRQGLVVHAVKGQRDNYHSLQSLLSNSIHPRDVVQAFINTYRSKTIYVADLDAIQDRANNDTIIDELHTLFPAQTFWVDQGLASIIDFKKHTTRQHVIGSETDISCLSLREIIDLTPDIILSLDYRANIFLGDQSLLQNMNIWPDRIIIMSLAHVGSNSGPDYELVSHLKKIAGNKQLYVAGGVRHERDLELLEDIGIAGVLLASALHTQQINAHTVEKFSKKMPRKRGI